MKTLSFMAELEAAIREGRKTQTRRPVDDVRYFGHHYDQTWHPHVVGPDKEGTFSWWEGPSHGPSCYHIAKCPYGGPGTMFQVSGEDYEIVNVRVERLQDISALDCLEEGVLLTPPSDMPDDAVAAYRELWESINGPGSWDANPWVWVIEFKRVVGS